MITALIIDLVAGLVQGILGLVPEWNIDTSAITGFGTDVGALLARANGYLPVTLLLACLGILLAVRLALLAWRTAVFVYSMVPFN